MSDMWDDMPTAEVVLERQSIEELTALLLVFAKKARSLEGSELYDEALATSIRISGGYALFTEFVRQRVREANETVRRIQALIPPSPIEEDGKVLVFKTPEPLAAQALTQIRKTVDDYARALAAEIAAALGGNDDA